MTPPKEDRIQSPTSLLHALWSHPLFKKLIGPIQGNYTEAIEQISSAIRSGTLLLCCNGSYSPDLKMGSHGWIFTTEKATLWWGAGLVDWHPDPVSPFRAKLGGLIALLHLTLTICSHYNLYGGQTVLYCGCLLAIKRLQQVTYGGIKEYIFSDFDLLHEVRPLLKKLRANQNITVSWDKDTLLELKSLQNTNWMTWSMTLPKIFYAKIRDTTTNADM